MQTPVNKIVIVGGGSAGWLTAAYALYNLPNAQITLIESPNVPTVGVGEATILGFDHFLTKCGIPTELWTKECDATIKLGTYFPNWRGDDKNVWQPFYFPIEKAKSGNWHDYVDLCRDAEVPFEDYEKWTAWYDVSVKDHKVASNTSITGGPAAVGYHLDAIKLANFLSSYCNKKYPRLRHIQQHISMPAVKDGLIDHLVLEDGQMITGDFFVDCTGFKRLLSNALADGEWVDRSHMLFTNAAVASQINYETEDEPQVPYVTAQATDHGWIWKTPVKDRIGSGLCYNSDLTTKQEAEDHFVQHWGEHRLKTGQFNHVPFKPEYNKNNWRGNCFSVGLASGFIEPLESTGLALLIIGSEGLSYLKKGYYVSEDQERFNEDMSNVYEDSMGFVALHYFNNPRQSKFWKHVEENFKETKHMEDLCTTYARNYTPTIDEQFFPRNTEIFQDINWKLWLNTIGIKTATANLDKLESKELLNKMRQANLEESYPGVTNRQWSNR
jgi:tryptophan halogenase